MIRAYPNALVHATVGDIVETVAALSDIFGLAGNVIDGQFHVLEVIGEGGFSVVYKGQHLGLREPVAIKCLKINKTKDPTIVASFTQRFFDESRISYRLSQGNLNIVRSITSGTTISPRTKDTVPYMVLEWLEGESLAADFRLRRMRKKTGRSLAEVMQLFEPAAMALAYAHAQGIAHRDVKPGNLFLARIPGGETILKVLDFGMAKVLDVGSVGFEGAATINSLMVISPQFSAPEQFEPSIGTVGAWTDVYSLALVMVEALADRRARTTESFGELMMAVTDPRAQPTPRKLGIMVSDSVEAVFASALAVDPKQRPKSAGELWSRLKQAVAATHAEDDVTRTDQKLPDFGRTISMPAELPPDVQHYLNPPTSTRQTTAPMEMMPMIAPPPSVQNQTLSLVPGANSQIEVARALAIRAAAAQSAQPLQPSYPPPQQQSYRAPQVSLPPQPQAMMPTREPVQQVAPEPSVERGNGVLYAVFALVALIALGVAAFLFVRMRGEASVPPVPTQAQAPTPTPTPSPSAIPSPSPAPSACASVATTIDAPVVSAPHAPARDPKVGANTALSMTDTTIATCKQPNGPVGKGTATVTFGPDGAVSQVAVSAPPFGGTAVAQCIAERYRTAKMAPFVGAPVIVEHVFDVPP